VSDTRNRLELILSEGEGQRVEFKEGLSRLDRELVAFANSAGGTVLLGVDDMGNVTGIDTSNRMRSEVQAIARNCDPAVRVDLAAHPRRVLEIRVPEGQEKPYRCREGFYLRQGPTTQKLSTAEIRRLVLEAGSYHFDETLNRACRFPGDFDDGRLRSYLEAAGIHVQARPRDILLSLDVAVEVDDGIALRQAGVLFFAREPQRWVRESHVTCVRFRGIDRTEILDRQEIAGNPTELIEGAMAFTRRNIRVSYTVGSSAQRREIPEYPLVAVREAVTNAVMHRDYQYDAAHVFLSLFADRLEIENPGGLYSGLTVEELGKRSVRRNRLLADLLFRARYVERVGSGIPRMKKALEENGNPPMEIAASSFFVLTLRPRVATEAVLTTRQTRLYQFVAGRPSASKEDAARFLSVSADTTLRELRVLVEAGLVVREGIGKATVYRVSGGRPGS
jgi:ATP-dependent DNA helicase RecG